MKRDGFVVFCYRVADANFEQANTRSLAAVADKLHHRGDGYQETLGCKVLVRREAAGGAQDVIEGAAVLQRIPRGTRCDSADDVFWPKPGRTAPANVTSGARAATGSH